MTERITMLVLQTSRDPAMIVPGLSRIRVPESQPSVRASER
jgi:hypothetical protein